MAAPWRTALGQKVKNTLATIRYGDRVTLQVVGPKGRLHMDPRKPIVGQPRGGSERINIEMRDVTSSNVAQIGYDATRLILRITFHNGSTYDYYGVPWGIWWAFNRAESKGKFVWRNLRFAYVYHKHRGEG